jgi:hypothetical protein
MLFLILWQWTHDISLKKDFAAILKSILVQISPKKKVGYKKGTNLLHRKLTPDLNPFLIVLKARVPSVAFIRFSTSQQLSFFTFFRSSHAPDAVISVLYYDIPAFVLKK